MSLAQKNQGWRNNKVKKKKLKHLSSFKNKGVGVFSVWLTKKNILLTGLIAIVFGVLFFIALLLWFSRGLPEPNQLLEREIAQSTIIYDRTGKEVLYKIHGEEKRTLVKLSDVPKYVQQATIAIEDKNFYKHSGVSLWGIFRGVVWQALRGKRMQGGSTLTQQFVKNAILSPERKITRKIKEWLLSSKLEKKYSKDEILQMYFNEIPYGSNAYGIEAASNKYFGKNIKDVTLAESAILAALPQAPSLYSPFGSNKDLLIGRQHYILGLMAEQGFINQEEAEAAKKCELVFQKPTDNITAPHFVMYIKEQLAKKYGEKMIEQGGLRIYTTLDLYKQKIAEEIIAEKQEKNLEKYQASNAALVSIDPKTGQILAMVGSKDYFSEEIDGQVNITTSLRQPGSSLKPLIYASCFIKGYSPQTMLYDVVTNFSRNQSEPYEPHNYDLQEHGAVSIRKALAGSLNIPAVKAIYLAGIDNVLDLADELGYSSLKDRDRYGLALVLGGAEVKLLEHTNAFSAFAREGKIFALNSILKIEDSKGNILEEYQGKEKKVLDPKASRMINSILSDNSARAYAFGERNWLTLGSRPVAAKTGTTNDYRDAWTIGYTPSIVTGVWVGNNNNDKMKRGSAGGVVAAPIWHDYMDKILGDTPIEYFQEIKTAVSDKPMLNGEAGDKQIIKIDKATGFLATEFTPQSFIEEKIFLQPHSILYFVNKKNPLGPIPENPGQDSQFELWETAIKKWTTQQASSSEISLEFENPPIDKDNIHIKENTPSLSIVSPSNNQTIFEGVLSVKINTSAPRGLTRVEYYLNGNLFSIQKNSPYSLLKRIDFLNNGFHNIKIRACDDVDNCLSKTIDFNLKLENSQLNNKEILLSIIHPSSGLAISDIDFPLNINVEINYPELISKINFYYKKNDISTFFNKVEPVEKNVINYSWPNSLPSGSYQIYAEAITWTKEKIISPAIIININSSK